MKPTILKVENISKWFGSLKALDRVSLTVRKGERVGLVGDNGAGKSTLVKILMGLYHKDEGNVYFDGKKVDISSPRKAKELGIEAVYQDRALSLGRTIRENIFMGREITKRFGVLDVKEMNKKAIEALHHIGFHVIKDPDKKVGELSGGQQQGVAVSRTTLFDAKLLLLDEPTAGVSKRIIIDTFKPLFKMFKDRGTTLLYISHELEGLYALVDRIVILKSGRKIIDVSKEDITIHKIIENF